MQPLAIVELVDVTVQGSPQGAIAEECTAANRFGLERVEERLHMGVVRAAAETSYASMNPMLTKQKRGRIYCSERINLSPFHNMFSCKARPAFPREFVLSLIALCVGRGRL